MLPEQQRARGDSDAGLGCSDIRDVLGEWELRCAFVLNANILAVPSAISHLSSLVIPFIAQI
jgi:hypothetical protein